MKKRIFLSSLLIALLSLLAFNTVAYYSSKETVTNVITTGSIDLDIVEVGLDGKEFPLTGVDRVTPGSIIVNNVSIKNSGNNPMWLRVKAITAFSNETLDTEVASLDFNLNDWTYDDGWYYYNEIIEANHASNELFSSVTFSSDSMDNKYQNSTFTLKIVAEAVQSENNGNSGRLAFGWED